MKRDDEAAKEASLPALGEVLDFMRLLWKMDHELHRASKRMERSLGVTGPQRLILRILGRFPGLPAGQLARLLWIHPATLTGMLKRLESHRLLRRRADPRDGRRALLSLTDEGRVFDVEIDGTIETAIQQVLAQLSREKLHVAREVFALIAVTLGDLPVDQARRAIAPARRRPAASTGRGRKRARATRRRWAPGTRRWRGAPPTQLRCAPGALRSRAGARRW